jgi:hypothetical protein
MLQARTSSQKRLQSLIAHLQMTCMAALAMLCWTLLLAAYSCADTLSGSLSVLRTLLMRTTPREILVATSAIPAPLLRFLKSATGGAEITSVPAASMPAPAAAASVLAGKAAYKAIAQVVLALGEAERPSSGLAALIGLLTHLDRLKMLETLSSCVQVRQLCRTVYACRHFHALLNGIAIGRCSSRSKKI